MPDPAAAPGDFSNLLNAAGQKITVYDPDTSRATAPRFIRDPFPGNIVPANRISPITAAMAKVLARAQRRRRSILGRGQLRKHGANIINKNTFSFRLDHNFSDQDRVFVRYSYDDTPKISAGGYGQTNPASPAGGTQDFTRMNAVTEETHIFGPSPIGEFRGSFSRFANFRNPFSYGFDMTKLGFSRPGGASRRLAGLSGHQRHGLQRDRFGSQYRAGRPLARRRRHHRHRHEQLCAAGLGHQNVRAHTA